MIAYNIISTGSKGNAVVINNNILIDCGVPYKALSSVYKDLRLVLLTHVHGDHFNRATIKALARERPTLRWGVPEWLAADVVKCSVDKWNIDVIATDILFNYAGFCSVKCNKTVHNVDNCAWHIFINDEAMFYATDTNSIAEIEAKGYDLYMIEANYSETEIVERIKHKQERGEYCHEWDVLKNHLSKEKADDWLYSNMHSNSRYLYMHEHK